jgi:hypothetical protein
VGYLSGVVSKKTWKGFFTGAILAVEAVCRDIKSAASIPVLDQVLSIARIVSFSMQRELKREKRHDRATDRVEVNVEGRIGTYARDYINLD